MVKFLFFAQLAESAQCGQIDIGFKKGNSINDYIQLISNQLPESALTMLKSETILVSLNQSMTTWGDIPNDGDEVGLLPPFSGG